MILLLATVGAHAAPLVDPRGGLAPLHLGDDVPTAESCGACHPNELAEWRTSRHRASWTNLRMQQAYVYEQRAFCVNCHAPLPRQQAEIHANRAWYRSQDPRDDDGSTPERLPEPHAANGIECATCHWRDGSVVTARAAGAAPHSLTADPTLGSAAFCEGCHDFAVPDVEGVHLVATDVPMQTTTAEWRAWGGSRSCQDCHMPNGSHRFVGASDPGLLRRSLAVTVKRLPTGLRLTLRSRGVGHHLPSGDVFRQLVVEVDRGDGFEEVARFGKELAHELDPFTGDSHTRVVRDNALRPGEPVQLEVATPHPAQWRVRYLYTSEPALVARLPPDEQSVVLRRGTTR